MIRLLAALKLCTLLSAPILVAAFGDALVLWWMATLYRRLEPFVWFILYPLQWVNGFLYLLRMAFNSFLRHGRRPGDPHFGFYQVGQLYDWQFKLFDEDDMPHSWMPSYYATWITAANSVLFDSWLGEQNMTLFFRWGSFARYLFLWGLFVVLSLGRRVAKYFLLTEYGLVLQLTFWRCWPFVWRLLSRPLWFLSQGLLRFLYAIAGDFLLANLVRFLRLEGIVRFQWYQQRNVGLDDTPETFYRRPWPLAFYRFSWYGDQRQQQKRFFFSGDQGPLFFLRSALSLLALLCLSLLILPLALLAVIFFASFSLYNLFCRRWFALLAWAIEGSLDFGQRVAFRLFAVAFYGLASLPIQLAVAFLSTFLWIFRRFAWGLALMALLLAFGSLLPPDFTPLLAFGFGSIFLEFFERTASTFSPFILTEHLHHSLSLDTYLDSANYWRLRDEWQAAVFYNQGNAYHGHLWQGFHTSLVGYENPPWMPRRSRPSMWVKWWHRKENWWWWDRPIGQWGQVSKSLLPATLLDFQAWIEKNSLRATDVIKKGPKKWYTFKTLLKNYRHWGELFAHHSLADALWSVVFYKYNKLASMYIYNRDGYYWLSLAAVDSFYALCLVLTLFLEWVVDWPLYRLRTTVRFWALHSSAVSWSLSFFFGLGSGLLAFFAALLSATPSLSLPAVTLPSFQPATVIDQLWRSTPTALAFHHWLGAVQLAVNFFLGWVLWYLSIIFDELCQGELYEFWVWPSAKLFLLQLLWLVPRDLLQGLTGEQRLLPLWTMALTVYLALQEFWDRIFLPLELPRFLDDYTLSFRYRRLMRSWAHGDRMRVSTHRGSLLTTHRWKLPAVFLFRQSTLFRLQLPETGFKWLLSPPVAVVGLPTRYGGAFQGEFYRKVQDRWIMDVSFLPFYLDDGMTLLFFLSPCLYVLSICLFFTIFPGTALLVFDRPHMPGTTAAIFNRQWAWDGCRFDQPLEDFESLFYRYPSPALLQSKVALERPFTKRSRSYFDRLYDRYVQLQGWPPLLAEFLQQRSLSGGLRSQYGYVLTERRLLVPFAQYLFEKKYNSLRKNYLDQGLSFLRFISINYRRNPWVPLCHNQFDQYDYHSWVPDGSLDFAERCVQAGADSRRHLEKTDRLLFQKELGHWVWYKDMGNQEFERTSSVKHWHEVAYEVDDKDHETYFPWGGLWWFFVVPYFIGSELYLPLEQVWAADSVLPGTGGNEMRRLMLWWHNLLGHFLVAYNSMEYRGWWHIPAFERPDNPTTDTEEAPINQYHFRWDKGEAQSFYPVPMRAYHYDLLTVAPWGTSQPIGLLEEYVWFRRCIYLLLVLSITLLGRYSRALGGNAFALLTLSRRWPLLMEKVKHYYHLTLWFWK